MKTASRTGKPHQSASQVVLGIVHNPLWRMDGWNIRGESHHLCFFQFLIHGCPLKFAKKKKQHGSPNWQPFFCWLCWLKRVSHHVFFKIVTMTYHHLKGTLQVVNGWLPLGNVSRPSSLSHPKLLGSWWLGCGFKHFLFLPLPGEIIQFDKYFSDGLKPPTRWNWWQKKQHSNIAPAACQVAPSQFETIVFQPYLQLLC